MPYLGNVTTDFNVNTENIDNQSVTAIKLSPASVGSNGQVLGVNGSGALQWVTDSSTPGAGTITAAMIASGLKLVTTDAQNNTVVGTIMSNIGFEKFQDPFLARSTHFHE